MSAVKPGDLCLVLSAWPGDPDAGKMVTAIRVAPDAELLAALQRNTLIGDSQVWLVNRPMMWDMSGGPVFVPYCPSCLLRPLRDPGETMNELVEIEVTA